MDHGPQHGVCDLGIHVPRDVVLSVDPRRWFDLRESTVSDPGFTNHSIIQKRLPARGSRFLAGACTAVSREEPLLVPGRITFDENVEWWRQPSIVLLLIVTFPVLLWIDVLALIWILSASLGLSVHWFCTWILAAWRRDPPIPDIGRGEGHEIHVLDSHCVAWMLDTSMDRHIHRITLGFLEKLRILITSDPSLFTRCLNILSSCIHVDWEDNAVLAQGLEGLGKVAVVTLLRVVAHFSVVIPASSALYDVRQKYRRIYPIGTDFRGISFHRTTEVMHSSFHPQPRISPYWKDYEPSPLDHTSMARKLVLLAWSDRQCGGRRQKVPRWTLRFVLHTDAGHAIAGCLLMVAFELGHEISMDAV